MLVIVDDHTPPRVRSVMRRGTLVPPVSKPGFRVLDTDHHTCPNHTGRASLLVSASMPLSFSNEVQASLDAKIRPCEGCVAESYALEWLLDRVNGLEFRETLEPARGPL